MGRKPKVAEPLRLVSIKPVLYSTCLRQNRSQPVQVILTFWESKIEHLKIKMIVRRRFFGAKLEKWKS